MADTSLLSGFAFSGFRSFSGADMEGVGPLQTVHLLAGPNNSGKSSFLKVAQDILPSLKANKAVELDSVDIPLVAEGDEGRRLRLGLRYSLSEEELADVPPMGEVANLLYRLLTMSAGLKSDQPGIWLQYEPQPKGSGWRLAEGQVGRAIKLVEDGIFAAEEVGRLSRLVAGQRGGGVEGNVRRVITVLDETLEPRKKIPEVRTLGAFRRIQETDGEIDEAVRHNGLGLREQLAELQNPGGIHPEKRARFDRIVAFVKVLFEDPDAELEIPYSGDEIHVRYRGNWLPLQNYGDGLHEVIILAAAATVLTDTLLCVEEPEIHLHPTLQRRLLSYLARSTENQYLVATHSAHMLDSQKASISAVRFDGDRSVLDGVVEPAEVARIGLELGARASDLVQANAVIWVEGPSDRVYLLGWIEALAPKLVLGIHFEVMYYGGSLLTHLSADDPGVDEFVSLPRINRNFAVVIDSDRTKQRGAISATKRRIKQGVEETDGAMVWITAGYTIENYVPTRALVRAMNNLYSGADFSWSGHRYRNPLASARIKWRKDGADKVAVARQVMSEWSADTDWPHDLRSRVNALVKMIRAANDITDESAIS